MDDLSKKNGGATGAATGFRGNFKVRYYRGKRSAKGKFVDAKTS